jgi:hypothetical protein
MQRVEFSQSVYLSLVGEYRQERRRPGPQATLERLTDRHFIDFIKGNLLLKTDKQKKKKTNKMTMHNQKVKKIINNLKEIKIQINIYNITVNNNSKINKKQK